MSRPKANAPKPATKPDPRAWLESSCASCVYFMPATNGPVGLCRRRVQYVPHKPTDTCGEYEAR